jgi:hypothetical protein
MTERWEVTRLRISTDDDVAAYLTLLRLSGQALATGSSIRSDFRNDIVGFCGTTHFDAGGNEIGMVDLI